MNKYYVATKIDSNQYTLNEFESLSHAYRFYLEDPVKRIILKTVNPEIKEGEN